MEYDSNLTIELRAIDEAIEREEINKKRGEALEWLMNTEQFKLVITDGYLETEAKRCFDLLTSVPVPRHEVLEGLGERLNAIRYFKDYIGTPNYPGIVRRAAENADTVILEQQDYRKEVTAYYEANGDVTDVEVS